ncbi:guanylate kinase [Melioribacter sp. Ez-97]|uniref:guanylate kinase n=1 Tax=Melioribacter sp. Ez-97 TaxID=3423434 RepID=UPI003EDADACD
MTKPKLFVFSAPSGAGKTTIVKELLKTFPELKYSVSATTRKKRPGEIDGVDYYFLTEEEFKKKIENGEFVEWEKFYDYYYGTLKKSVDDNLANGYNTVFEVDVKGALNIKKIFPDAVLIFIVPPDIEALKKRLLNRKTETEEDLKKRIERAEMELGYKDKFDYVVENSDLQRAIEEVKKIINKEISEVNYHDTQTG